MTTRGSYLRVAAISSVLTALLVVAVMSFLPASGAPGDTMVLGAVNSSARATALKTKNGFRIVAANPTRPPLQIVGSTAEPPLEVESDLRVDNLNADLLDGLDPSEIVAVYGKQVTADIDDFTGALNVVEKTIDVPFDGYLHITGSVDFADDVSLAGQGDLTMLVQVDGAPEGGASERTTAVGEWESISHTVVVPVSAGARTVQVRIIEDGTGSYIDGASLSIVYSPNGDVG